MDLYIYIYFFVQEDPYLDYGHEPLLKQDKVVIHNDVKSNQQAVPQKPDLTLVHEIPKQQHHHYPDLLSG